MNDRLIYDVGAHEGYDTSYYLKLGFRVVAIEANPRSCTLLSKKFHEYLKDGRLTLLNIAVSPSDSDVVLHISKSDAGSCSLFQDEVDDIVESVSVISRPFGQILDEFGILFSSRSTYREWTGIAWNRLMPMICPDMFRLN